MLSPWIGAAGLVADIAGFAVITWDVWPEYRLARDRQRAAALHDMADAAARQPRSNDPTRSLMEDVLDITNLSGLNSMRRQYRLDPLPRAQGHGYYASSDVDRSRRELVGMIDITHAGLMHRSRPPLGVGVALIVAGFVMQLLSALPLVVDLGRGFPWVTQP